MSPVLLGLLVLLLLATAAALGFMRSRAYKAVLLRRAAALASAGRTGRMISLLQRNRDRSSVTDPLTNALVYFFIRSGRYDEAEKVILEAMERGDRSGASIAQLAFSAAGRGDAKAAEELYRKSLEKDPGLKRTVNVNLAMLLLESGRLDEAELLLEEALELREGAARCGVHSNLALLHIRKGQPRDALVHAMSAYELQPASELSRVGRAQSLALASRASGMMGDSEQARSLAGKALKLLEGMGGVEKLAGELAAIAEGRESEGSVKSV
ncbi:tetratricopeptide repeat protein [Candidatus Fermentibacteria bacterium]|nr:tetratricopeptide repeat protein [Candidatus Fermentibacteria bacterium]